LYELQLGVVPVRRRHKVFIKGWTGKICPVIERSLVGAEAADGHIAQLVEQLTLNQRVVGSIPTVPTIFSETRAVWPFFLALKAGAGLPETFHRRFS
jgi:hypothetical protein